ncbi:flavin reductase family protein [Sphingomonas oligophenolica]|uniref:Flavin reductase family protein n=1 Tax=Sphingomonas oligophenolica TaxID=301154 RepID=A0ABU9YB76_9SPHN
MAEADYPADTEGLTDAFKRAMRRLASTVSIITCGDRHAPFGMTATAVTSLSTNPPSLLTCVNQSASIHDALGIGSSFCVNLLGGDHGELAAIFGGQQALEERFKFGSWDLQGLPRLIGAQASVECSVDRVVAYHSHSIIIGRVRAVHLGDCISPLIYGDGRLHSITEL